MSRSAKVFAAIYFLSCCVLMLTASLVPGGKGFVAVFSRPGGDSALEIIANAGGRIIFVRDATWVAVTEVADDEDVARLYREGAGFVASSLVARACARLTGVPRGSLGENAI